MQNPQRSSFTSHLGKNVHVHTPPPQPAPSPKFAYECLFPLYKRQGQADRCHHSQCWNRPCRLAAPPLPTATDRGSSYWTWSSALSILCDKPELVKKNKNAVVASSSHLLSGRTGKNKDLSQWSISIISRTGKHEGWSHCKYWSHWSEKRLKGLGKRLM